MATKSDFAATVANDLVSVQALMEAPEQQRRQAFAVADLEIKLRRLSDHEPDTNDHKPFLARWGLYFKEKYGLKNREQVAKAVTRFWEDGDVEELVVPGTCRLGGFIYGHDRYPDGAEIFTSNIRRFVRVERGYKGGIPHDLCYAETTSGSKYYFFTDQHDENMFLFFGGIIHFGGLETQREYYVPPRHRGKGYL